MLHRFGDIAFDMSHIAILVTPLAFNLRRRGSLNDLRKILQARQRMAMVQNGLETLGKISPDE